MSKRREKHFYTISHQHIYYSSTLASASQYSSIAKKYVRVFVQHDTEQ